MDLITIKIRINLITNEKLYGGDWECDNFNEWYSSKSAIVTAPNIQEALEIAEARANREGLKWSSVSHSEELAPRRYREHSLYNNEYTDRLHELYG